eukprot:3976058-Pleurochrysis_carterae.AAC.1
MAEEKACCQPEQPNCTPRSTLTMADAGIYNLAPPGICDFTKMNISSCDHCSRGIFSGYAAEHPPRRPRRFPAHRTRATSNQSRGDTLIKQTSAKYSWVLLYQIGGARKIGL